MNNIDELLQLAARVKELREALRIAEERLESYVGRHSSSSRSSKPIGRKPALAPKKAPSVAKTAPRNSIAAQVRRHMESHPTVDFQVGALMSALNLSKKKSRAVRMTLRKLRVDGKVTRPARGLYRWKAK